MKSQEMMTEQKHDKERDAHLPVGSVGEEVGRTGVKALLLSVGVVVAGNLDGVSEVDRDHLLVLAVSVNGCVGRGAHFRKLCVGVVVQRGRNEAYVVVDDEGLD